MDNSIYITLSRQTGLYNQIEVIANNIANANTTAFKGESMLFKQYLMPNGTDFYNDRKLAFTHDASTVRNLEEGSLQVTNHTFDFAITGEGYFAVETPLGTRYTRAGNFSLSADGTLVTSQGYPVLDADGQRILLDPTQTDITMRENGLLTIDDQELAQLGVFNFPNSRLLEKVGQSLYRADVEAAPAERFRIVQGMLESSNVQPVTELTALINVQRSATESAKLISSLDELERNAIQTIAKTV